MHGQTGWRIEEFVTFWWALDAGFGRRCIACPGRNRLTQQCDGGLHFDDWISSTVAIAVGFVGPVTPRPGARLWVLVDRRGAVRPAAARWWMSLLRRTRSGWAAGRGRPGGRSTPKGAR